MDHLVEVDDYTDHEHYEEGTGEEVVGLGEEPEEDTEDQENVKGFYHLEKKKFQNRGLFYHHCSWSISILQVIGLGLN